MGGFAALLFLPFNFAYAVELLDPTRPPVEASFSGSVAAVPSGPVLQSVKITPGRRTALISGQLLAEGQRFGEAKLVRITEGEVVLSGPEGRQTLRLFPDVEKHAALPPQGRALKPAKNKLKRKTEQKAP